MAGAEGAAVSREVAHAAVVEVAPVGVDVLPDRCASVSGCSMLCRKPFVQGMRAYPCGQCMPCRFNRRRMWTHRIMLETQLHPDNAFVTLTYSDTLLPLTPEGRSTLRAKDAQDWLKRLRKKIAPSRIRYYLVGEYGDETNRPHYHAAVFGLPACTAGQSQYNQRGLKCCLRCELVRDTWGLGNIYVGNLGTESAQYICGYVTKKMNMRDDPRLDGRDPEFCRMSLRPGIGLNAMHDVASTLLQFNLDTTQADVPSALRHGSRTLPLGHYLKKNLRLMVGKDAKAPQATLDKISLEMRPLLKASQVDADNPSLSSQIVKAGNQKVLNMSARQRLFKKGKTL